MTKTTEKQLLKRIEDLESKVREADTILCSMILMELGKSWPSRVKRAVDDWIAGKSIWSQVPQITSDEIMKMGHTPIKKNTER